MITNANTSEARHVRAAVIQSSGHWRSDTPGLSLRFTGCATGRCHGDDHGQRFTSEIAAFDSQLLLAGVFAPTVPRLAQNC